MRWFVGLWLLLAAPLWAGNIQYLVESGHVTGASDLGIAPVREYAVVSLAASVGDIVWPIPAGCPAGQPEWSAISDPETVAVDGTGLIVQPALIFFSSTSALFANRCAQVSSAVEVWAVVNEILDLSYAASTQLPALDQLNTSAWIICPDDNVTQACVDVRAGMVTLNAVPANAPGRFRSFVQAAVQLRADAQALITLMGW